MNGVDFVKTPEGLYDPIAYTVMQKFAEAKGDEDYSRQLEEEQIIDSLTESGKHYTAAAITISGASYIRVSGQPVSAETPFYLYSLLAGYL